MEFPKKCTVLVKLYCHNAVNGFNSHVTGKFQFVKIGYDPTWSWDEELFKDYVRLFYTIRYHDFWIFRLSRTFETQVRHLRILRIAKKWTHADLFKYRDVLPPGLIHVTSKRNDWMTSALRGRWPVSYYVNSNDTVIDSFKIGSDWSLSLLRLSRSNQLLTLH